MMPSCVPATGMETSEATILPTDIHTYLQRYPNRVIGLAEMMNYPGVISKDNETLSKLIAAGPRPKDGHAPLLSGKSLDAYVIAGLGSDHECTNLPYREVYGREVFRLLKAGEDPFAVDQKK